jgi:sugar phosphate isomerase/epimerase
MLCYSTASLPDSFSSTDIAEALLPTPFRGVELVVTPAWLRRAGDASFWHGFRQDLETRGLRVRNVQLGHPHLLGPAAHSPGLSATDPAGRRLRVEAAVAAAGIAERLGSGYVTVTTGLPERAGDYGHQESLFKESLAEIVARRPPSVKVAIEQEPEHVIRSADQVLGLCRAFDGEVFSNYDVGHGAVLGEDPAAAVRLLGKYLSNLHLEDIRGRTHKHLLFGEGDIDFRALFRALREIGYAGDLTPDLYPYKDQPARALRESAEFLAAHHGAEAQLGDLQPR